MLKYYNEEEIKIMTKTPEEAEKVSRTNTQKHRSMMDL
jgi:hypothetical protein